MTKPDTNTKEKSKRQYDLLKRTASFGKNVIQFAKTIPENTITKPLISQFIRSGTSVGANYHEADNAESKNDFKHKIGICKKEAKETCYWLQMIVEVVPNLKDSARLLWQESHELNLIFNAIVNAVKKNS